MKSEEEIRNKVDESGLITFNLEDLYQVGDRLVFDLKDFLFEGLILREKDYRKQLKQLDWSKYKGAFVAITCSADAILPQWAFMLATTYLQPFAKRVVMGNLETMETVLFQEELARLDMEKYRGERVIIKGCSRYPVPTSAYVEFVSKLLPVAKSVMYGEACSTVPLFKKV